MATQTANRNLHAAKNAKKDEFYTQLTDIENELRHYRHHFKNKVVYCNCDDPRVSKFFHYFSYNFEDLGLKKLIGQTVNARIELDEYNVQHIVGKVISIKVNDFYFYEKGEPIYITVSINPSEELDEDIIDSETLATIPLDCITKY